MAETATEQPHEVDEETGIVYVGLVLAHPYAKEYAARVQAKTVKDYKVGETIFVTREWGNALIEGGFVQIDPLDKQGRQKALLLNRRNQPLTGDEMAAVRAATEKPQDATDAPSGEAKGAKVKSGS